MIIIKDKLNRTNICVKRDNIEVEYVTEDKYEDGIGKIERQIIYTNEKFNDYVKDDEFETEIEVINNDIEKLNEKVDDIINKGSYDNGYDDGYSNGYADGENQGFKNGINTQKSKLKPITISENGIYSREDGYNEVVVDVPQNGDGGYDIGYENGVNDQKSKLETITIKNNGTYIREDGYNKVVVNIPESKFMNFFIEPSNYGNAVDATIYDYIEKNNPISSYGVMYSALTNEFGHFNGENAIIGSISLGNISKLDDVMGGENSYNSVLWVDRMNCEKITETNNAFGNCNFYINYLNNLGKSFKSEQEVVLPKFEVSGYKYYYLQELLLELVSSLYNFKNGNEYGVTTSTLKFYSRTSVSNEVKQKINEMGWKYSTY